jgi:putative transposase
MKQNKAYKYRLYPNQIQSNLIDRTIGCVRLIYNKMLADKIKHYEETKQSLKNYPAQYKDEYPFLKEVDSLALANAQLNLQSAYSNFFRRVKQGAEKDKLGFPKFKSKKKAKWSYTTNNQRDSIRIENNTIRLPKVAFVKLKLHRNIPNNYIIKSVTITKTRTNKYYISILVEYENQIFNKNIETAIGLDFSMKKLYVDSNNHSADYPKYFKRSQDNLAKEQRIFSHRKPGSNRYNKQRVKVAKVHEYISNQRKDFLHKESRKIANNYDLVCIEDLDMQEMSKHFNFGKSIADNSWRMFITFLKYKLEEQGKHLVIINKWFPSSKTCNVCKEINHNLTLNQREWICKCGVKLNRDFNAAINILNFGLDSIKTIGTIGLAQRYLS